MIVKGKFLKLFLGIFALFAILSIFSFGHASALPQEITMSPATQFEYIKPGSTSSGSFNIFDQGSGSYKYTVYVTPYRVINEEYDPSFTYLPGATDATKWVKLSSSGGYIISGQEVAVNYTISVPTTALPGGYYIAVFAQTNFPKAAVGVTLNERVGQIFYMQVAGPAVNRGQIITWESKFFQKPPLTSKLRIENSGSVHFKANINVTVKDIFGGTKYRLTTLKVILPQTIRLVNITWQKTPSFGLFKVSGTVGFLGKTHILSTKYVLVMSNTVRLCFLIALILIVIIIIIRIFRMRKKGDKGDKKSKNKD